MTRKNNLQFNRWFPVENQVHNHLYRVIFSKTIKVFEIYVYFKLYEIIKKLYSLSLQFLIFFLCPEFCFLISTILLVKTAIKILLVRSLILMT